MKNRYKISLLVIAIMLAISMTVGTSYAFWTATKYQEDENLVTSGCLEIAIDETDVDGNVSNINLTNAYPVADAKGVTYKPYTLTIKNVCTINAKYSVLLNTLSSSALTENQIKYHFVEISPTPTTMTPVLIGSLTPITLDSGIVSEIGTAVGGTVNNSYLLAEGTLDAETENVVDSVTYNLRLWIDEAATEEIMGETFEAAIAVYAEAIN